MLASCPVNVNSPKRIKWRLFTILSLRIDRTSPYSPDETSKRVFRTMNRTHFFCGVAVALSVLGGSTDVRAGTTDWQSVMGGAVRLVSADVLEDGSYLGGIEFILEQGWHTYWRYPGEAGIPPELDFSASENLGSIEVLYPAPERYDDGYSTSIVYHHGVVLPLRIKPARPDQPVRLNAKMFFGICSDICVPGEADLALDLSPSEAADRSVLALIQRDLDAVPVPERDDAPRITQIEVVNGEDGKVMQFSAKLADPGADKTELFAEGPEGSYIGVPKLLTRTGNTATWTLSLNGLAHSDGKTQIRFVLVDGATAVEGVRDVTIPINKE